MPRRSPRAQRGIGPVLDEVPFAEHRIVKLVARGELPVIRLGRRRLVPKVALLDFVAVMPEGATQG